MDQMSFWEQIYRNADRDRLLGAQSAYRDAQIEEIGIFRDAGVRTVCDAGCGIGAYTLALAENGFCVKAFDLSESAVRFAREGLARFGYDVEFRIANILCTGYEDGAFDGAFAHSVLDHMTRADAALARNELCRIVRPDGLILLSFDAPDEDDKAQPHTHLPDGSILYTGGSRSGMILHPYDREGIRNLVRGFPIVHESVNPKGEQIVIFVNRSQAPENASPM